MKNLNTIKPLIIAGAVFLSLGSLFLLVETALAIAAWHQGDAAANPAQISVSGTGDAFAVPDTAEFSFTVQESAKTVADAQAAATALSNKAISYLKNAGIADADVQTDSYDITPQYANTQVIIPVNVPVMEDSSSGSSASSAAMACINCGQTTTQTIIGYQVSESIDVKVRDTSKAGTILAGIGSLGVQNISGLNLTVDNPDTVTDEARTKAIQDAENKAQVLAHELGVSLVRITNFSDDSVEPIGYGARAMDAAVPAAAAPQIPVGQNKVTSNVTITYEVR